MSELRIANDLSLGLDAVTKTFAILAQRRKGKTYTASVLAEELVRAGQPWVALDPTGAWWGLRAGADGSTKGGLPVYVFGGQHGDLPLERTAGKVIADLVVDEPRFYVLDLSAFESKEAERQFATDFAERLYRRKAKSPDPLHLFVDEADVFVPQRIPKGDPRMVGAFEAIVRRGGIRGIGTTLISQRAAVVNKNVLEQIDVLIVLRVVGPNDQKAIKAYIEAHGSDEERAELMGSLASLKLGEAWIWEPGSEPALFQRTQIRERHTYNSSETPKAGEKRTGPVQLADIDLDSLRGQIEATVEKAKADDPGELRKRIREVERELAERPEAESPEPVEMRVEVPVFPPELKARVKELLERVGDQAGAATETAGNLLELVDSDFDMPDVRLMPTPAARPAAPKRSHARTAPKQDIDGDEVRLAKAARTILGVLVERSPMELTRAQVSTLSGYRPKSSTFANALSELRTKGLMVGSQLMHATDDGIGFIGDDRPEPRTAEEVRRQWLGALPQAPRAILEELLQVHPDPASREQIAERTDYSITSSTFANALSTLRTNGLLTDEPDKEVRASDALFEEIA